VSQNNDDIAAVWSKMTKIRTAMMNTLHEGEIISRPMAAHADQDEGAIYFVSELQSGKTHDIADESRVNLTFSDPANSTFLSITGTARVSQDREKLRELWNLWAEAWLPEGPDAPNTALITVRPDDAVIWDNQSSRIVRTVQHLAAVIRQTPPDPGRVAHVDL